MGKKTIIGVLVLTLTISMFLGKTDIADAKEVGIIYEVKEEQGVSFETAYKLNLKKETVTGRLSASKRLFYFVYEVPASGKISMKISSTLADDMNIQIYDNEKRQILSTECVKQEGKVTSETTISNYHEKGIYYMKISPVINGDAGKFTITSSFTKTNLKDKEHNNDLVSANEIELGNTVKGMFSLTDTEDFYKVYIPSDDKGLFITVSSSISGEIGVYVKSANGLSDESGKALYKKNGVTSDYKYVHPGSSGYYYLRVFSKSNLDNGTYTIKTGTGVVVEEISVKKESITIKKGISKTIKPVILPQKHNEKITYTSSNPSIVKVDAKGKITGLKKGTAVITISSESGISATYKVKVKK